MIAGQLALLSEPADEPLANYHDSGFRAVHVEDTQTYLGDDLTIQSGQVAGKVPQQEERVLLDGHEIDVEQRDVQRKVASNWVADVDGKGWILADRTFSTDEEHLPPWPFSDFQTRTGREIVPMGLKPYQYVRNQRDADRDYTVEMASREFDDDDISIQWGQGAMQKDAIKSDVGVALTTRWNGEFVRCVLYGSGYLSIWEPAEMAPEMVGRFIHDEIVPISYEPESEDETTQETLESEAEAEGDGEREREEVSA